MSRHEGGERGGLHTQRRRKAGGESRFTFLLHALLFSPGERTIDRPPRTRPFAVAVSWTGFLCRISPQGIRKNARGCYSPSPSLAAEREREAHAWIHRVARAAATLI